MADPYAQIVEFIKSPLDVFFNRWPYWPAKCKIISKSQRFQNEYWLFKQKTINRSTDACISSIARQAGTQYGKPSIF
jgi:hypothetical protein